MAELPAQTLPNFFAADRSLRTAELFVQRAENLHRHLSALTPGSLPSHDAFSFPAIHLDESFHPGERADEGVFSARALAAWTKPDATTGNPAGDAMQWFHLIEQLGRYRFAEKDAEHRARLGAVGTRLFSALREAGASDLALYSAASSLGGVLAPTDSFYEAHVGDLAIGHLALNMLARVNPFDPRLPKLFAAHWMAVRTHQLDISMESLLGHWHQNAQKTGGDAATHAAISEAVRAVLAAVQTADGCDAPTAALRVGADFQSVRLPSTRLAQVVLEDFAAG